MIVTTKKIIVLALVILAFSNVKAQRIMKDPVSFKLKNGIEVIVAENSGMGKVYANLKIEGDQDESKKEVSTLLGHMLTEGTSNKIKTTFENNGKEIKPKVSLNSEEGNVASAAEDFESAFLVMSAALQQPVLNQSVLDKINQNNVRTISLDEVKSFYNQKVSPSKIYITIAGDITVAEAKALSKKAFGDWKVNNDSALAR